MNKFEAAMGRMEDKVIDFAARLLRFCVACVGSLLCRGIAKGWRKVEEALEGKGLYRPTRRRLVLVGNAALKHAAWTYRANRIAAWGRL